MGEAFWFFAYIVILLLYKNDFSYGYTQFQERIPNGDKLPHPCKPNYIWHGVGHLVDRGGGKLNDFGKDFLRLGKVWNTAICQIDSDGDGQSNGEELGDPECVWVEGKIPKRKDSITHPGICDPYDADQCRQQNSWVDCDIDEMKCDSIHEDGVKNVTIRMPKTKVPSSETNFMCTVFDLPSDGDYHIIANKPFIDNEFVMHHMLLFGCPDTDQIKKLEVNKPQRCSMGDISCNDIIGTWTVRYAGECNPPEYGYRIGTAGYKRALLQTHWNNPELRNDYVDSSGLTLYYTSKKRSNNAGVLMVGNTEFDLPPGEPEVTVVGNCSSGCSKVKFNGTIYVSTALNHMHYLGRKQKMEVIRNGVKIHDITNEDNYSYDKLVLHRFDTPIEVRPGDEIKTTCVFKTTSKINTTHSGYGTNDEMCFGFLTFYPEQNVRRKFCGSWKSLPVCKLRSKIGNCFIQNFKNLSHPEFVDMRQAVKDHCSTNDTCLDSCRDHISIISNHPCMKGDVGDFVRLSLQALKDDSVKHFYRGIDSCSDRVEQKVKLIAEPNNSQRKENFYTLFHFITVVMFFLLF